ncbi:MAG: hypothetical protein KC444_05150 [Nitrosopumilus sp.]|nr:hypothetical protein [Nitrosopumilus sp.]
MIVFSLMAGILLPARLLFVQYVSDDWLGSFGVISALSLSVIILVKKKKLGAFGPMLERQMYKFQEGKRGILIFGESVFLLLLLGCMIFAIHQGNLASTDLDDLSPDNSPSASLPDDILDYADGWGVEDWLYGFLMAPVGFLTAFPQMSIVIATVDQRLDGWLMHFYTVGFVEYVELLGILIFYRLSFSRKPSPSSTVHAKTPV